MWLLIIGVALVGFIAFGVIKTAAMNNDPRSQELVARLMLALAESKLPRPKSQKFIRNDDGTSYLDPPTPKNIIEGWADVLRWLVAETPDKSPGQRATMVAHALSVIKPHLDEYDFANFRGFARNWDGHTTR